MNRLLVPLAALAAMMVLAPRGAAAAPDKPTSAPDAATSGGPASQPDNQSATSQPDGWIAVPTSASAYTNNKAEEEIFRGTLVKRPFHLASPTPSLKYYLNVGRKSGREVNLYLVLWEQTEAAPVLAPLLLKRVEIKGKKISEDQIHIVAIRPAK